MKKVFLKDILKEGEKLPSFKKVSNQEMIEAKKYLDKEYAKLEKLWSLDEFYGNHLALNL